MAKIEKTEWWAEESAFLRGTIIFGQFTLVGGARLRVKRILRDYDIADARDLTGLLQAIGEYQKAQLDKAAGEVLA